MDHYGSEMEYDLVYDTTESWLFANETKNSSLIEWEWPPLLVISLTATLLGLIVISTIIGNVFVIAAVFVEKNLQNSVANYLIVSLAVADLMVACLVMPLSALYEISGNKWILPRIFCDMWTSSDVLACTASILHLVAIAVDRYWAVTDIEYIRSRNRTRINTMILLIWLVAFIVSLAPILGWKDPQFYIRLETEKKCLISQDVGYQIFATCATFYVPLFVILVLYWKIFQAARRRIRRRPGRPKIKELILPDDPSSRVGENASSSKGTSPPKSAPPSNQNLDKTGDFSPNSPGAEECIKSETIESLLEVGERDTAVIKETSLKNGKVQEKEGIVIKLETLCPNNLLTLPPLPLPQPRPKTGRTRECLEAKREKKAAKTLAIITGAFVVCWLPFFVVALTLALCSACSVPLYVESGALWLGYFNSTLNPIIYTLFSPEFRAAFKRILCGRKRVRRTGLY